MRTMNDLRMVKADLQRSQDDFGGHKNSAIEACEKAMQELDAVMKAIPPQPSPQQNPQAPGGATSPLANPRAPQPAVPPASGAPPAQPQQ
jgi:hypothetical protein